MSASPHPVLVPTEEEEQAFAQWLDWSRVTWCHVPNGGERNKAVAGKLRAAGVKAGVPDCLIFDRPACDCYKAGGEWLARGHEPSCNSLLRGVAVELKRRQSKGRAKGASTPRQLAWHARLNERGWVVRVCYGADEAIAFVSSLGIGKKP